MITETKELIMKFAITIVIIGSVVGGCSYINKKFNLKDDHIGEEFLEEIISDKIGLKIDLTPRSAE